MTHERAYSLRWLHVIGPVTVVVVLYAYYLGPMLARATGNQDFEFLNEWIYGILLYWTDNSNSSRLLDAFLPNWGMEILGINYNYMAFFGGGWIALASHVICLLFMAMAGVLFLRTIRDKTLLPATRQMGLAENVILSVVTGVMLLAIFCCVGLGQADYYHKFTEFFQDQNSHQFGKYKMYLNVLPYALSFLFATIVSGLTIWYFDKRKPQFWKLEKMTFRLCASAITLILWTTFLRYDHAIDGSSMPAIDTAEFLALLVLLWAWTCRVILLFNFARFKRESLLHPDSSCFACGYDLRGSRHSPTCPECGVAVPVLVVAEAAGSSEP